jgi:hypothetical protein
MPKISKEEKEAIKLLPQKELAKIVIDLISKDKSAYNLVCIRYLIDY